VNQVPDTPACGPWGTAGGGCSASADCPTSYECVYQFCSLSAPSDMGPPPDVGGMAPPDLAHPHLPHPDLALAGGGCATNALSIGVASNPVATFATAQVTAMPTTSGCKPTGQSFVWSFVTIPAGSHSTFNNAAVADPSFVADVPNASWKVHLTYTNLESGQVLSAESVVQSNGCYASAPTAVIQAVLPSSSAPFSDDMPTGTGDLTFGAGTGVQLSALLSNDQSAIAACGTVTPLSYTWTLVIEPPGSLAHLSMMSGLATNLTLDVVGRYVVALTATNGTMTSAPSYVRIDAN
jgi:hypothetical protein